jgi:hypothetical protein
MRRRLLAAAALLLAAAPGGAEPKKPEAKDLPKVVVAFPMGLAPGKETKIVLRGLKLDEVTEVRLHDPKGSSVKVVGKGKAPPPGKEEAARVGDTQLEIQATLSPEFPGGVIPVSVVTPAGESPVHPLLVDRDPVVSEKEPNNGFRQAQPVQLGQTVEGQVGAALDVDVFRFEGKEGQRVVLEVKAARYGSALDSLLTLYDADGRALAANDDLDATTTDSRIEFTLPKTGAYYVGVQDANDQGGPAHVYRLALRAK